MYISLQCISSLTKCRIGNAALVEKLPNKFHKANLVVPRLSEHHHGSTLLLVQRWILSTVMGFFFINGSCFCIFFWLKKGVTLRWLSSILCWYALYSKYYFFNNKNNHYHHHNQHFPSKEGDWFSCHDDTPFLPILLVLSILI